MKLRVLLLAVLIACGGGDDDPSAVGTVIDVQGGLTGVSSFSIQTDDGRLDFTVADDAIFHGGPMSHLQAHLVGGEPVEVFYVEEGGGLVAIEVGDA